MKAPVHASGVLPSGVRLEVASDTSLPVAAVVLAIETGFEDDPETLPGLTHALAFQLLEGTRELRPGGALAAVHDVGGFTRVEVGAGLVRFESLVPASHWKTALWVETERLLAPSIQDERWAHALTSAEACPKPAHAWPPAVRALIYGAPSLGHDGHAVPPALRALDAATMGTHLAERFTYDRATLAIVTPRPVDEVFREAERLFGVLPSRPRPTPAPHPAPAKPAVAVQMPAALAGNAPGEAFGWPLPVPPRDRAVAIVLCRVLDHLRPSATGTRTRCRTDLDARRGGVVVHVTGRDDPSVMLSERFGHIAQGRERALVAREAAAWAREQRLSFATPLAYARALASLDGGRLEGASVPQTSASHGAEHLASSLDLDPVTLEAAMLEWRLPAAPGATATPQPPQPPPS